MIADLTYEVAKRMRSAIRLPVAVEYGRPRLARDLAIRNEIWVRRTRGVGSDQYEDPTTTRARETATYYKWVACDVVLTAADTRAGAEERDHERLVEALSDAFLVHWRAVCHAKRYALRGIVGGLVLDGADDSERSIGAHYVIKLQVGRAVLEQQVGRDVVGEVPIASDQLVAANETIVLVGGVPSGSSCGGS